jgi:hypothetical protein
MTQTYYGIERITAFPRERNGAPGFSVMRKGGYQTWSHRDVFEAAYQPSDALSFGHALAALKAGESVARAGWNGKDMWLYLQRPDRHSKMSLPYIYLRTVTGDLVPWLASQTDMLADDWCIIEATNR